MATLQELQAALDSRPALRDRVRKGLSLIRIASLLGETNDRLIELAMEAWNAGRKAEHDAIIELDWLKRRIR